MTNRRRALLAALALVACALPSRGANTGDASSTDVLHARGTARLGADERAGGTSLELEYWSASPRLRLRCRAAESATRAFDVELAFDGVRYQLVERRAEEAVLFSAETPARDAVLLAAEGSQTRYRLSLSPGPNHLPLRIERLAGGSVTASLELLYSGPGADQGGERLPRAVGLMLSASEGAPFAARGNLALQAPRIEALALDTFTLEVPQRGGR